MADIYAKHELSEAANRFVEAEAAFPESLSAAALKELRTKRATSTSFFFAMGIILKVSCINKQKKVLSFPHIIFCL